jgi:DNA-directed DNA polymerase III PolC
MLLFASSPLAMFVPLHVKSEFSAGYGTAPVEALVRRVAAAGWPALALTDVENLYGQALFHRAARAHGLKAITGLELRSGFGRREAGGKRGRLVLLARDREGYASLCRIVTRRRAAENGAGFAPLLCLDAEPRGVMFLSDDGSAIEALLRAGVPAGDVRFLMVHPEARPVPAGVRAVADPDVVMPEPQDWALHRLRRAIHRGQRISEVMDLEPPGRSFPDPAELAAGFRQTPDALVETLRVAEECSLALENIGAHLPSPPLPPGQTPEGRLWWLSHERLAEGRRARRWSGAAYDRRLDHELTVIRHLGFSGYFLIAAEIAEAAREKGIALVGRGSAVGSLLAHILGLSAVDPVASTLYFERFLHEGRGEPPDIDLDVQSSRRDELIEWVLRRFGRERAAMVSAHQRFGRRSAFRHGLKAFGLSPHALDQFSRQFPADELDDDIAPAIPVHLLPEGCRAAVPLVQRLIGTFQHLSVHPGGVVIAPLRLDEHVPLERAPKGVLVTQYDMRSLALIGLVKLDLLGSRALGAIAEARRLIGGNMAMSDGDPATLDTLREGRTVGCSQIETPAVRSVLKKLPMRGVADLVAALALVRPGPGAAEAKAAYLKRANGEAAPVPPHPRLSHPLRESHGILLYEEDLMATISAMTGWSLERADDLRAEIVRAEPGAPMTALEEEFTAAAVRTGLPRTEAAALWEILARFAAYTFSKAHAASYAELAWQSAYLKTHHAPEFTAAILDHYGGHYPLRTVAAEMARAGVRLLPPDVNASGLTCSVESGGVRIGLGSVKYLTARSRARILARRPFRDVHEVLGRTGLAYRELEALVLCGACDGLAALPGEAYPFAHLDVLSRYRATRGSALRRPASEAKGKAVETYRALVRIRHELTYLGMHLTDHPLRVLREEAIQAGCVSTAELGGHAGRFVRLAGLVAATRRVGTRAREVMQFVTLEDEHGFIEAVLLPAAYARLGDPVTSPGPFIVGGRIEVDEADPHLVVSEVTPFHLRAWPYRSLELTG